MPSKIRFPVDAETAFRTTAQAAAGGAVAATDVTSGSLALDRSSSYWADGDSEDHLEFAIFGYITEVVANGGHIVVQASTDLAFTSPVAIITTDDRGAAGQFHIVVAKEELEDYNYVRLVGTQADGTSGIEFWAYASALTH